MKYLFLSLFFLFGFKSYSQSEVESSIQLLNTDLIADATLDKDAFLEWVGNTTDALSPVMEGIEGKFNVMITMNFTTKGLEYKVATAPMVLEDDLFNIFSAIDKSNAPVAKNLDYSMVIMYTINGGPEEENPQYYPAIDLPYTEKMNAFEKLSLQDQSWEFEAWMQNNVIPAITTFTLSVNDQFEGVISVGEWLDSKKYLKDVTKWPASNCNYWRGIMEMERWNQIILFSKMCALYGAGEYDRADRLLYLVAVFSDEGTLGELLYEEIATKRGIMNKQVNNMINAGIAFHDKGKYDEAIAEYNKVLNIFPRHAWANYEVYFSEAAKADNIEDGYKLWDNKYESIIYDCDPLYHMDVHASTGKEAYLLYRRQETNMLFNDSKKIKEDLLNYADIAFDLEVYDFAGELYWLIFSHLNQDEFKDRNILAYYLYCLEKLGCGEWKANFDGKWDKEFKKVEKERKKVMEESVWYKSMAK